MEFLIKAAGLILSLSILIVLHELGHFIPAKLFKTRVEKFYLFFNPWFSLFKVKRGETEYGLGWLPLGGYVKISGMIDESMDKEQMNRPPEPWEFRSKPAWQRFIIMVGGVTVNVLLSYFIFIMVLFAWGKDYLPNENLKYGIHIAIEELKAPGLFQEGDKILTVGGRKPKTLTEAGTMLLIDGERDIVVNRNGETVKFTLPEDAYRKILSNGKRGVFDPRFYFVVSKLEKGFPAEKAGFAIGDSIVGVNKVRSPFVYDLVTEINKNKSKEITVYYKRNFEEKSIQVKTTDDGRLGLGFVDIEKQLTVKHINYGFFESIPAGFKEGNNILAKYVKSLGLLFTKEGASQVGGFGSIGSMFPSEWNWHQFWLNTAFLSMILAFMNILPIPALDGGHIMFLLWEMVTGRPVKQKVLEYAQIVGFVLLMCLLLFANGNDIIKLFR